MTTLESKLRALVVELRAIASDCEAHGYTADDRKDDADRIEALLAERQEPPEPFSDKALLALAEDMLADCTAEQVQRIWQRAVYVKQNPWQVIADLLNAQRTGAVAAPFSGTGERT